MRGGWQEDFAEQASGVSQASHVCSPQRLSIPVRRHQASRKRHDERASRAVVCHLILPGTRGTSVPGYIGETEGGRGEGRLQEGLPASQAALLTAGERLQSRLSSRAQGHTFASLSPSTLGTFWVSLRVVSILFPSRKTTAPSSIPSCKRSRVKHLRDSAE